MTQPRFINRILHGPRDHEEIRFLPDWVHIVWAWSRPGCCWKCEHPNYLHYINCPKLAR